MQAEQIENARLTPGTETSGIPAPPLLLVSGKTKEATVYAALSAAFVLGAIFGAIAITVVRTLGGLR